MFFGSDAPVGINKDKEILELKILKQTIYHHNTPNAN